MSKVIDELAKQNSLLPGEGCIQLACKVHGGSGRDEEVRAEYVGLAFFPLRFADTNFTLARALCSIAASTRARSVSSQRWSCSAEGRTVRWRGKDLNAVVSHQHAVASTWLRISPLSFSS
ncbi:MAG: hypothetical protein AAB380_03975 [Verrucomicrobiota bacterium]